MRRSTHVGGVRAYNGRGGDATSKGHAAPLPFAAARSIRTIASSVAQYSLKLWGTCTDVGSEKEPSPGRIRLAIVTVPEGDSALSCCLPRGLDLRRQGRWYQLRFGLKPPFLKHSQSAPQIHRQYTRDPIDLKSFVCFEKS